jgi:hypothetical protein
MASQVAHDPSGAARVIVGRERQVNDHAYIAASILPAWAA